MDKTNVKQEGNTLTIERTFDGPIEKVWKAYADKEWFERWWGPEGWQTTAKEFDFRPGGRVHYDMHCVDKAQGEWFDQHSWGIMDIESIDAPHSFVYTDGFSDETGVANKEMPTLKTTITLEEADGKTTMKIHAVAGSKEQVDELLKMGMIEGFSSQMNRLDAALAE